jgi:predicted AAA+ superfamily ATPase
MPIMRQVSDKEIEVRLRLDNPWWQAGQGIDGDYREFPRRSYLPDFSRLVQNMGVNRAVVLLGPRRVGKTIMVYHAIQWLMDEADVSGRDILYLSLETPIYSGLVLEALTRRFQSMFDRPAGTPLYVFFDEIQYLKDWEIHLKSLVDTFRDIQFVATGSAAAALKAKSVESGAGRFTEFQLPPLTFAEYLLFVDREDDLIIEHGKVGDPGRFSTDDMVGLNEEFIRYLNFGGFPEAVFSERIQVNPRRYIKSDIIDKVLMRDLPILYGITDIQELNSLFNTLAYNTGLEVSLSGLAQTSHVAKNTLIRYMEYLEAAFLIKRVRRIDADARHFKRMTTFKLYLTNPTMRAALFGPVAENDEAMGQLAETAVFSQWLHNTAYIQSLYYARWPKGEVDLVSLEPGTQRPRFAIEVKWSDRVANDHKLLRQLISFAKRHKLKRAPLVTTYSYTGRIKVDDIEIEFSPTALHCYTVARNTLERQRIG